MVCESVLKRRVVCVLFILSNRMVRVKQTRPGRISPKGQPFMVRANAWRYRPDAQAWTPYTRAMNKRVCKTASRVELALQLNAFDCDMVKARLCFDRL